MAARFAATQGESTMSKFNRSLVAACIFAAPVMTSAQTPMVVGGGQVSMLKAGTQVPLKTMSELTTNGKRLKVGDRFNLEVSEAVRLNNRIAIPAGSLAVGEITTVRNKGMWGKSGNIDGRVLYVRANGQQIRLTGTLHDKGVTGTGAVVGAVVLLPLAGFFMTGTSATLPAGTQVTAYLNEDLPIQLADAAPESTMIVPVSAAGAAAAMDAQVAPVSPKAK